MSKFCLKETVQIHSPIDAPVPQTEDALSNDTIEDSLKESRRIFDPTLPRAKYSLHPLGYLYFFIFSDLFFLIEAEGMEWDIIMQLYILMELPSIFCAAFLFNSPSFSK